MKRLYSLLLLCSVALSACGKKNTASENEKSDKEHGVSTSVRWLVGPFVGADDERANTVEVSFVDQDGAVATKVEDFTFWIYMKVHGHGGIDRKQSVTQLSPGRYLVKGFLFTMTGPWELEIRAKVRGESYRASHPVEVHDA